MGYWVELVAVLLVVLGFIRLCRSVGHSHSSEDVMVILGESMSLKTRQRNTR